MRVRVTQATTHYSPGNWGRVEVGQELDLEPAVAADLINSGNAISLEPAEAGPEVPAEEPADEVDATQAAIDHAEAMGIDLAAIQGTGKDGRVTKADVEAAIAAKG